MSAPLPLLAKNLCKRLKTRAKQNNTKEIILLQLNPQQFALKGLIKPTIEAVLYPAMTGRNIEYIIISGLTGICQLKLM